MPISASMDAPDDLPFKVGQIAESRSFQSGFRGAWFRCKIKKIARRHGQIGFLLEYYDYTDDDDSWLLLYQRPPLCKGSNRMKRQLMVRPHYPPMYHESEMPPVRSISEVTVIVQGPWEVGNLVEWCKDDCFWSGRITQVVDDNKIQIELTPHPDGQGGSFEASCKDLRPSLDWSLEYGWRVPTPMEGETYCCARLIHPVNQAVSPNWRAVSMTISEDAPQENAELDVGESEPRKPSSPESTSASHVQPDQSKTPDPLKTLPLNSTYADTLESAILDLEELVNRVRWMRRFLEFGASGKKPSWKFVEHHGSSSSEP